jgi:hypothetical protein
VGMSTGTINLKIPGKPTIPNLYARNDNAFIRLTPLFAKR